MCTKWMFASDMTELKNWRNTSTIQRNPKTGCIPAGYEWLLRYAEVGGIDLSHFQEEFDFDEKRGEDRNNFESVANAIQKKYSHVEFKIKAFEEGFSKVTAIENLIKQNIPCLISLALTPQGNWHIMPVICIDNKKLKFMNYDRGIFKIGRQEVIRRHNKLPGGRDIAWLEVEGPNAHSSQNNN